MNSKEMLSKINLKINKIGFEIKKASPEILAAAGVVGVVTSVVLACKATTKIGEIMNETNETLDAIHEVSENPDMAERYTQDDAKRDLAIVYIQTAVKFARLYAPALIIGSASLACLLSSNQILRKRNVALAAAYATVDKSFKEYRARVVDRFGEEVDHQLKYNIQAKEIEEKYIDENGDEQVVKKTVEVASGDPSEYARFFDEACGDWTKSPEMNLMFLRAQQQYANDLLRVNGYLYLNDVYDMIGIPKTKAGQVVGWIYDENNDDSDNFVDFGIYDLYNEKKRDFVNGYERSILLDFNVDGYILDKVRY